MRDITPLVAPKSIAVIGASTDPNKSGGVLFGNLATGNFDGALYPINPRAEEILSIAAYPEIAAVPEQVDLAYIVLPREHVNRAIEQCSAALFPSRVVAVAERRPPKVFADERARRSPFRGRFVRNQRRPAGEIQGHGL